MAGATPQRDWLTPGAEQHGLQRYVAAVVARWWVVVLCVLLTTAVAAAYLATTSKSYESSAQMLVTPISSGDDTTVGLGLIRDSNDPTRDVSTASRLVTTVPVARRVIAALGLKGTTPTGLLNRVQAVPVASSSVISVTASGGTAREAARLANAFATQTVRDRTDALREQLDRTIPALRQRLAAVPAGEQDTAQNLTARLAALEALRGVPDPTMRVVTPASPPEVPTSPRPKMTIVAGIFAGLVLGLGGAFAVSVLDPRLRREEQLREIYRLPVLARVPHESGRHETAIAPNEMSNSTHEAYRTLRATLAASRGNEFRPQSVLVTSSSPGEGKTTTAINLAHSLVQAGNRVILIEADMHRPQIGIALGIRPQVGIAAVLIRQVALEDALVTTREYGPDLRLLLVDRPGQATADRLSLPTARQLVAEAEELADYVIVDSPPLTAVVDALPLAQQVTDVVVVTRLGRSKLRKLTELGELLEQNGVQPTGVAIVGVDRAGAGYYYAMGPHGDADVETVSAR